MAESYDLRRIGDWSTELMTDYELFRTEYVNRDSVTCRIYVLDPVGYLATK